MWSSSRILLLAVVLAVLAACGSDDTPGGDDASSGDSETAAAADGGGDVGSIGSELDLWQDPDAAARLPVPDTLRISRQGWGSGDPFFAARDEETPKDAVLADVERLADELGWRDVEFTDDGAWTHVTGEHDEWTLDFSVVSIREGAGTTVEGGMSPRG